LRGPVLNIRYEIVEIVEGVGQTTTLSQITSFNPSKYRSSIIAHRFKKYTSTLFENIEIHVPNSYYTSFLERNIVDYFTKFDVVIIKSGIPFFLAALRSEVPKVYALV
jgi:phosphorylcholine metabolism protein LicD